MIKAIDADSELQIIVRDQGYGIPKGALERIFEKFYRLERDNSAGVIGTGLGLAFVKDVAEKHGGRISLESQENIGSTFTLHLPK
jgi:signal transduction histidine kinase